MRILLTEGSGLTSRQVAGRLGALGHQVGVLSCDPLGLTRFTRAVGHWHRSPAFGDDPLAWIDAALEVYRRDGYALLFPTQEQVTVLAACEPRLRDAGVVTAVPPFEALVAVQDKIAAHSTLDSLGLAQPDAAIVTTADELASWDQFPVFVKVPIGTATSGVHRVERGADLLALSRAGNFDEGFADGGVLMQTPEAGPLAMLQAVFERGHMVAFHANLRVREGARGGASHKRSAVLPEAQTMIETLGTALRWHGALSADVILTPRGPSIIDINPRLVEPGNAYRAGTDLVGALMDAALGATRTPQPAPRSGVDTHQLLLALLGAAESRRGRRGVAAELLSATTHRDSYRGSAEELTPLRRDWRAAIPVAAAASATLIAPRSWRWFAAGSVANYALTPAGWRSIRDHAAIGESAATEPSVSGT